MFRQERDEKKAPGQCPERQGAASLLVHGAFIIVFSQLGNETGCDSSGNFSTNSISETNWVRALPRRPFWLLFRRIGQVTPVEFFKIFHFHAITAPKIHSTGPVECGKINCGQKIGKISSTPPVENFQKLHFGLWIKNPCPSKGKPGYPHKSALILLLLP